MFLRMPDTMVILILCPNGVKVPGMTSSGWQENLGYYHWIREGGRERENQENRLQYACLGNFWSFFQISLNMHGREIRVRVNVHIRVRVRVRILDEGWRHVGDVVWCRGWQVTVVDRDWQLTSSMWQMTKFFCVKTVSRYQVYFSSAVTLRCIF